MKLVKLRKRIDSFKQLSQNWDSYGGLPITDKAIESAHKLMTCLNRRVFVAPCPDGGILFDWDTLEIYIDSEGNIGIDWDFGNDDNEK